MLTARETFEEAARRALAFLEQEHGFALVEVSGPPEPTMNTALYRAVYCRSHSDGDEQFVVLAVAPIVLECDLEFGRGEPHLWNRMNVMELLAVEEPHASFRISEPIYESFGDLERMTRLYTELAGILQKHGARFFANDDSLWEDIRRYRDDAHRHQ